MTESPGYGNHPNVARITDRTVVDTRSRNRRRLGFAYRWFNIGEATVWLVFSALVLNRWRQFRHSSVELYYALAFTTFGLTDIREASVISAGLLLANAVNLAALLWLRSYVMRRWYAESRLY